MSSAVQRASLISGLRDRVWQVGDALKFKFHGEQSEHTGIIIRMVDQDRAIVRWDDGFRDSGVNLSDREAIS